MSIGRGRDAMQLSQRKPHHIALSPCRNEARGMRGSWLGVGHPQKRRERVGVIDLQGGNAVLANPRPARIASASASVW